MFPKTVKVRGLAIEVGSWEELDEVLRRYGNEGGHPNSSASKGAPAAAKDEKRTENGSHTNGASEDHDMTLLRAFMQAAQVGIPTAFVQSSLPKAHGRGMQKALAAWAERLKLTGTDAGTDACIKSRPNGGRGWRLSNGALAVAQMRYPDLAQKGANIGNP
jgi:hypothetical protein